MRQRITRPGKANINARENKEPNALAPCGSLSVEVRKLLGTGAHIVTGRAPLTGRRAGSRGDPSGSPLAPHTGSPAPAQVPGQRQPAVTPPETQPQPAHARYQNTLVFIIYSYKSHLRQRRLQRLAERDDPSPTAPAERPQTGAELGLQVCASNKVIPADRRTDRPRHSRSDIP